EIETKELTLVCSNREDATPLQTAIGSIDRLHPSIERYRLDSICLVRLKQLVDGTQSDLITDAVIQRLLLGLRQVLLYSLISRLHERHPLQGGSLFGCGQAIVHNHIAGGFFERNGIIDLHPLRIFGTRKNEVSVFRHSVLVTPQPSVSDRINLLVRRPACLFVLCLRALKSCLLLQKCPFPLRIIVSSFGTLLLKEPKLGTPAFTRLRALLRHSAGDQVMEPSNLWAKGRLVRLAWLVGWLNT